MIHPNDMIAVFTDGKRENFLCSLFDLQWPPPETIELMGRTYERRQFSQISDEAIATMTHVVRGAVYREPHDLTEGT